MGVQVGKAGLGFSINLGIQKPVFVFSDLFWHKAGGGYPDRIKYIGFYVYLVSYRKTKYGGRTRWGKGIYLVNSIWGWRAFYIQHD